MQGVAIAKGVNKVYKLGTTKVQALKGINLSVEPGEFLAIAGSSGSGKTTLLNMFGCIDFPTEGEIEVLGRNTGNLSNDALADLRARKIGFIFQTFNLLPVLTALENVEYPLLILNLPKEERIKMAEKALDRVGLKSFMHHRPDELSGGQRQRVAIARALVKGPELIIADEPTANLDKKTAVEILDLMYDLNTSDKVTFIFSSHDSLILSKSRRVFYLSDGQETTKA